MAYTVHVCRDWAIQIDLAIIQDRIIKNGKRINEKMYTIWASVFKWSVNAPPPPPFVLS